jgi:hypothetical protein
MPIAVLCRFQHVQDSQTELDCTLPGDIRVYLPICLVVSHVIVPSLRSCAGQSSCECHWLRSECGTILVPRYPGLNLAGKFVERVRAAKLAVQCEHFLALQSLPSWILSRYLNSLHLDLRMRYQRKNLPALASPAATQQAVVEEPEAVAAATPSSKKLSKKSK